MCYILTLMPKKQQKQITLESYGLEMGQRVRFKPHDAGDWDYAVARGIERDGSIRLMAIDTGATRSLPVDSLQRVQKGPRGGTYWVPVLE